MDDNKSCTTSPVQPLFRACYSYSWPHSAIPCKPNSTSRTKKPQRSPKPWKLSYHTGLRSLFWCLLQSCHNAAGSLQGRHLKQSLFKHGTWCPHSSHTFSLPCAQTKQTKQPSPGLCINTEQISTPESHRIMEHSQGWGAGLRKLQRTLDHGGFRPKWRHIQGSHRIPSPRQAVGPGSHHQPWLRLHSKEHLTNPCLEHNTQMSSHGKPFTSNCTKMQMNH